MTTLLIFTKTSSNSLENNSINSSAKTNS